MKTKFEIHLKFRIKPTALISTALILTQRLGLPIYAGANIVSINVSSDNEDNLVVVVSSESRQQLLRSKQSFINFALKETPGINNFSILALIYNDFSTEEVWGLRLSSQNSELDIQHSDFGNQY